MGTNIEVIASGVKYFGDVTTYSKLKEAAFNVDYTDMVRVGDDAGTPKVFPLSAIIFDLHPTDIPAPDAVNLNGTV